MDGKIHRLQEILSNTPSEKRHGDLAYWSQGTLQGPSIALQGSTPLQGGTAPHGQASTLHGRSSSQSPSFDLLEPPTLDLLEPPKVDRSTKPT